MAEQLFIRFSGPGISQNQTYTVVDYSQNKQLHYGDSILRVTDGSNSISLSSPCDGVITARLVEVGQTVVWGDPIFQIESERLAVPGMTEEAVDEKIWNLAIATNAVFKGLLGSMGASGQIASRTVAVQVELPTDDGIEGLIESIAEACETADLEDGDVIVLAEKPFPVAQRRLVPYRYISETDPKKLDRDERLILLNEIAKLVDTPVEEEDLILADTYTEDPRLGEMATVGAYNHNLLAYQVAQRISMRTGKEIDVVISDTDTGIDIRATIIGCITLGATPIGATKGLSLYECMRASCAAEFTRGSKSRIPIVICKPAMRCRKRPNIGEHRGYEGKLKFEQEGKIAFA